MMVGDSVQVEVPCPDCAPQVAGNRAERRAAVKRSRRCGFCHGTGRVTKNLPTSSAKPDTEGTTT